MRIGIYKGSNHPNRLGTLSAINSLTLLFQDGYSCAICAGDLIEEIEPTLVIDLENKGVVSAYIYEDSAFVKDRFVDAKCLSTKILGYYIYRGDNANFIDKIFACALGYALATIEGEKHLIKNMPLEHMKQVHPMKVWHQGSILEAYECTNYWVSSENEVLHGCIPIVIATLEGSTVLISGRSCDNVILFDGESYSEVPITHVKLTNDSVNGLRRIGVLNDDQIVRHSKPLTISSAVHHQRHSPCIVLIETTKENKPYRVTVTPCNASYLPRRDIMPFDMFIDFGCLDSVELDSIISRSGISHAFGYSEFLELFDGWIEKCNLGVSSINEQRRFLPMFTSLSQYELAKNVVWSHGVIDDWATKPYRILETIIASENDRASVRGTPVLFGKNTVTQWAAKMGFEIERSEWGPIRVDKIARAYNKLLYHVFV